MDRLKEMLRGTPIHSLVHSCRALLGHKAALYDAETLQVMQRVLKPDSSCLDVGANRGDILKRMIAIAPRGKHHAFEPIPHHAESLRRKFPNVPVHETALSDYTGTSEFHLVTNATAYSGLKPRIYDHRNPEIRIIRVPVTTLDEAVGVRTPVDLIKIDVEGGEYHVLKGGRDVVARTRPVIVFEAGAKSTGQYGVTPQDFFELLDGMKYRVSTMRRWLHHETPFSEDGFVDAWTRETDYYFMAFPA